MLKAMLYEALSSEVTLLDAHSFAWMLSAQMESEKKLADTTEYLNLSDTEKDAIIKARIGQGQFRQSLIDYWSSCAVTGCRDTRLLRASHIKPWAKSEVTERLSLFNGLLLSPTLDACFDSGLDANGLKLNMESLYLSRRQAMVSAGETIQSHATPVPPPASQPK